MPSHCLKGLGLVKTTCGVSADLGCSFCPPIRDHIPIERDESSRTREHMFYTFLKHEYVQVRIFLVKILYNPFSCLEIHTKNIKEPHTHLDFLHVASSRGLPGHSARCRWAIAADVAVTSRLGQVAKK